MPLTTTVAKRLTFRATTSPDARGVPSVRAAQLIDHLLARQQELPILEKKTGLPYGWAVWLHALSPLPHPLRARELVQVLVPRPLPAPPGRLPQLGMWQAMRRLAWQQWEPAPRDQRWMRWTSAAASLLLHLLFAFLLLWVALIRTQAPPTQGGDGERIQVEFIGQGAQEGGGDHPGGDPASVAQENADAQAAAGSGRAEPEPVPVPEPARSTPAAVAQAPVAEPPPVPMEAPPAPPTPVVASAPTPSPPLQATEVAEPSSDFVVPPISVPRTQVTVVPRQQAPSVLEREVQAVVAPTPSAPRPTTDVRIRTTQAPPLQVREREVAAAVESPAPLHLPQAEVPIRATAREPSVREREVSTVVAPTVTVPTLRSPDPTLRAPRSTGASVRERSIPNAAAAASSPSAPAAASPNSAARTGSGAAPTPAQAGTRPSPAAGNWATPARGDDWGAARRDNAGSDSGAQANRDAGQGSGLFKGDGSVRVPGQDGAGNSERGAPGGDNDGWSRDRIAQSGTWLKRPPYDYTPTSFDKYWVPNESLLAEWVRKGIQSVEIPLPGTSTRISCVISVLQFGGGCGLNDPNMQDQPAIARPPPDIPFKKELQEDNGSR